jgi:hypothetical protein
MALPTALLVPTIAAAQGIYGKPKPNQQQQQQQAHQELHGKGELEAFGPGGFAAVLDGNPWKIGFEPKKQPKIEVTGSATSEFLAPGMFIKFKGDFDKKGKATAEVKDLEIFTPNEKEPLGATKSGGAFEAAAPQKGPPSNLPTTYEIAGRITGMKKGTMIVSCPNLTVHADVAPDATIKVTVADLSLASAGDKIEVKGWYMKGKEGYGYANEVSVQLANPLSGPKKKPTHLAKATDKTADKSTAADKSTDAASLDDKKTDKPKNGTDPKAGDAKTDATKAGDKATDPKADNKDATTK